MKSNNSNLRTLVLNNLFPSQLVELILKSAENLDSQQFSELYKVLVAERSNLLALSEEDDTSPQMLNGVTRTIELLKTKYCKN
jgi:hypothetical protein